MRKATAVSVMVEVEARRSLMESFAMANMGKRVASMMTIGKNTFHKVKAATRLQCISTVYSSR